MVTRFDSIIFDHIKAGYEKLVAEAAGLEERCIALTTERDAATLAYGETSRHLAAAHDDARLLMQRNATLQAKIEAAEQTINDFRRRLDEVGSDLQRTTRAPDVQHEVAQERAAQAHRPQAETPRAQVSTAQTLPRNEMGGSPAVADEDGGPDDQEGPARLAMFRESFVPAHVQPPRRRVAIG